MTLFDKEWDVSIVPAYITLRYYKIIQIAVDTARAVTKMKADIKDEKDQAKIDAIEKQALELEAKANETMTETYDLVAKVFDINENPISKKKLMELPQESFAQLYKHVILGTNLEKKTVPLM